MDVDHALDSQVWANGTRRRAMRHVRMRARIGMPLLRARRAVAQADSASDIACAPGAVALRRLANLLARYAPHDGVFPLRLPGTYALRRARMTSEPVHATLGPSLCIVAQGAKVVMLGSEVLEYDPARMLVFAVDLPVSGQVTRASQTGSVSRLQAGPGSCARGGTRRAGVSRTASPRRPTIAGCMSDARPTPSSTP